MFNSLTKNLAKSFDNFRHKRVIKIDDIEETIKNIRMSLLEADVNIEVVKEFCQNIAEKAIGAEVLKSVNPADQFVKIVQDEIADILQAGSSDLDLSAKQAVIMMVGLQGSGKTTSAAKLAKYLTEKKKQKVLVASTDIYRPAAREQLAIMAEKAGVDSLEIIAKEKPDKIVKRALKQQKKYDYDVLIIDTAGRLSIDKELIKELKSLKKLASPVETILVADALTGQDAVNTAQNFNDEVALTAIALTRVDGDQRGGAALSMKYTVNVPIKFMGVGEKIADFELFQAERIASRILDMGDIVSLVEKAQEVIAEEEAKDVEQKFKQGTLDLNDLLKQIRNMKKMGGFNSVLSLIPGAGKIKEAMANADFDEAEIIRQEAIILSMTMYERQNPDKLNTSRKRRIASGSGTSVQVVNRLLKKFKGMQKMMKKMRGMNPNDLMGLMNQ